MPFCNKPLETLSEITTRSQGGTTPPPSQEKGPQEEHKNDPKRYPKRTPNIVSFTRVFSRKDAPRSISEITNAVDMLASVARERFGRKDGIVREAGRGGQSITGQAPERLSKVHQGNGDESKTRNTVQIT